MVNLQVAASLFMSHPMPSWQAIQPKAACLSQAEPQCRTQRHDLGCKFAGALRSVHALCDHSRAVLQPWHHASCELDTGWHQQSTSRGDQQVLVGEGLTWKQGWKIIITPWAVLRGRHPMQCTCPHGLLGAADESSGTAYCQQNRLYNDTGNTTALEWFTRLRAAGSPLVGNATRVLADVSTCNLLPPPPQNSQRVSLSSQQNCIVRASSRSGTVRGKMHQHLGNNKPWGHHGYDSHML